MRFQVRFTNGYWRLFDAVEYVEVEVFFSRIEAQKTADALNEAQKAVDALNEGRKLRKPPSK